MERNTVTNYEMAAWLCYILKQILSHHLYTELLWGTFQLCVFPTLEIRLLRQTWETIYF